ncbi:ATP-grasp domain-containing protein [Bacillus sp. DJP31]|uniref:ATP-grasp domain-containing protein n=1 Tax=Bacillus sp. DJP31 TaxID=3409789 RepID=UPI003BB55E7F
MEKIYIIHENNEWTVHLTKRLEELGLPYEEYHMGEGMVDLSTIPPQGVFYNRMSASSHSRGHRYAPEITFGLLAWLERHDRKVLNGSRALQLELSKVLQYMALNQAGICTPKTIAATGSEQLIEALKAFDGKQIITKHNRAGKGLGVQLFDNFYSARDYVLGEQFEEPVDGITLVQEYIQSPDSSITRCEFVDGKFHYAVRVDTSGGFELCPAEACQIGDLFCPVGEVKEEKPMFEIIEGFNDPIIGLYEQFLIENHIQVAGIEFVRNSEGEIFTYDVNTNTNYNPDAEEKAGKFGMLELAKFLGKELDQVRSSLALS